MPRFTTKRRTALAAVATAAAASLILVGCSTSDNGGEIDPDAPVSFRMSLLAGAVESPYSVMAKEYMEQNPNVSIEIEEVPNEQYGEVLRTQLQGGNGPDVFYITGGYGNAHAALPLAEAGYLLPLTDTVANELVSGDARAMTDWNGEVWAQALDFVPVTNNYNADVAAELGLELPFETVDDVFEACDVAAAAGKTLLRLAGAAVPNAGITTLQMAASRVYAEQPDWNDLRYEGKVTFADTKGWADSLQIIVDLYNAGCFQPGAEGGAIADNPPAVASGAAVGAFGPGGQTGDLKRLNPEYDYVATAFPGDKKTRIFASPSNLLAVNAASTPEVQAAALKFLAWMAEPANANKAAELSGNISVRAGDGEPLPPQYALIEEYFADGNFQVLANNLWPSPEVYNLLGVGVQGLLTGQTDIPSVLASLDAAWDAAS